MSTVLVDVAHQKLYKFFQIYSDRHPNHPYPHRMVAASFALMFGTGYMVVTTIN